MEYGILRFKYYKSEEGESTFGYKFICDNEILENYNVMIEFEDDDDYKHEYNDFIDCVIISTLSSLYDEYGWKLASHSSDKLEYIDLF